MIKGLVISSISILLMSCASARTHYASNVHDCKVIRQAEEGILPAGGESILRGSFAFNEKETIGSGWSGIRQSTGAIVLQFVSPFRSEPTCCVRITSTEAAGANLKYSFTEGLKEMHLSTYVEVTNKKDKGKYDCKYYDTWGVFGKSGPIIIPVCGYEYPSGKTTRQPKDMSFEFTCIAQ